MEANESGNLESVPTAEVLTRLARQQSTGCLRIERPGQTAMVWFRDGAVYTATAPEARSRLGDRLVGAGHITVEQLDETLQSQRELPERKRIGELLIERGHLDRETMGSYVREQTADSVAATLAWTEGTWAFIPGEETAEDVPLDVSVENLLMEGARRLDEWAVVRDQIGTVDSVVDFVRSGGQAELALTPDEWSMLTQIDGQSTIADLAAATGYGQFEAARIVYGLVMTGVVQVIERVEAPPLEVDRELLFCEFAGLDESAQPTDSPAPTGTPSPTPRPARESEPAEPSSPKREPLPPPEERKPKRSLLRRILGQ